MSPPVLHGSGPAASGPPPEPSSGRASGESSLSGLLAALAAFVTWGILPLYWKALDTVDSLEIMCHRIVWSFVFLLPFMFFHGRLGALRVFLKSGRNILTLMISSTILAGNWYLYIWAINTGLVLEASLGYFINPLVNILFGIVIFRESISRLVWCAIAIAVGGVVYQVVAFGHLPIVPLALAVSFGIYGLLRKIMLLPSLPGLFVETLVVMPFAAVFLLWQLQQGNTPFLGGEGTIDLLLIGTGIATSFPLLCFAYGARRIRMTTLGLLQYANPSIVFFLGVFVYRQPLTIDTLITFGCIWTALALYSWDTIRSKRW